MSAKPEPFWIARLAAGHAPRLRNPGESAEDYRIAMGWDKPKDGRPCADCENVEPCDMLGRCIKHDPVPKGHDEYTKLGIPDGTHIEPCPVCAADAELWQYMPKPDAPAQKVVCCEHSDDIGPHDALAGGGCPLYMPPLSFYRPTIREAVKHWNEYAQALGKLRRANGWKRARVLRGSADGSGVSPSDLRACAEPNHKEQK
jgi:hypothetical protein